MEGLAGDLPQANDETELILTSKKMEEKKSAMDFLISKIKPEKLYTISEVSGILSLHENTVRTRIHEKRSDKPRLEFLYDGLYRIPGSAIIKYIREYTYNNINNN